MSGATTPSRPLRTRVMEPAPSSIMSNLPDLYRATQSSQHYVSLSHLILQLSKPRPREQEPGTVQGPTLESLTPGSTPS